MTPAVLADLLHAFSTAFRTRDLEGLLRLFSATAAVTYAGSESGEKATGQVQLRELLSELLGRPVAYSFDLRDITFGEHGETVWVLANGEGTQTAGDGADESFAYRLTGVLAEENGQWRWLVLAGSEPTPA